MKFIPRFFLIFLLAACAFAQNASNPFGLMTPWARQQPEKAAQFVASMHVENYRPLAIVLEHGVSCAECDAAAEHKFDLILTVRANGGGPGPKPTSPPDLAEFKREVEEVAKRWEPLLLVIENEPNLRLFYTGTPRQYLSELKAGCEAAHAMKVPCADGGLSSRVVAALTVKSYLAAGNNEAALRLARRTLGVARINDVAELQRILDRFSPQLSRAQQMLDGFAGAGADYVNFHWYEADPEALRQAVEFLKSRTGLPVITNEIGQRNDDPAETAAKLQTVKDLGLEIAIWYSGDGPYSRSLVNPDGSLRPTGEAFQEFMAKRFGDNAAAKSGKPPVF